MAPSLLILIDRWYRDSSREWIYDEGMFWKPHHRYWLTVSDDKVVLYDKGHMWFETQNDPHKEILTLQAADPRFLEKLQGVLQLYG